VVVALVDGMVAVKQAVLVVASQVRMVQLAVVFRLLEVVQLVVAVLVDIMALVIHRARQDLWELAVMVVREQAVLAAAAAIMAAVAAHGKVVVVDLAIQLDQELHIRKEQIQEMVKLKLAGRLSMHVHLQVEHRLQL
jgi:hypothetical protein